MGRRAISRIDPQVDLSRHLRWLEALPSPVDIDRLFGRQGPLEVEIGSGKGLFLLTASADHPDRLFLGNEISRKYARLAAYRLARAGRDNALVVAGDGVTMMARLPDCCAQAVHVYFPDPWWKARHRKRRVMRPSMVTEIQRVLVPGGRLHFWTDVDEYFESTCQLLAGHTDLEGPLAAPAESLQHDAGYRTHFERRMRLNQQPVFRATFMRQRD